ncbi:hypothetical protein KC331_g6621 [Hortaea werneckii]|uniref:Peptidase A1 domain-containing protein n=1 Tax=Hortaea werneckii TaxID=91943 RepID=A0A3M7BID4_HORWE|nr:hypothetical protein KC331_g6621 [Hortaea werneckii]KAI7715246.1 hypothetical protein KC353_g6227 [Hortaea werneckii]RMY39474.1 hypothetical protein D0865_12805 [Hortaea werneckii]
MDAQMLPSLIVIWLTFAQSIHSECVNESVVALPVTEVVLSNEHTVRGVPISVGTPPTNISFLPEAVYNDTWIYNSTEDFCNWTTPAACFTLRGGLYDTNSSTATLKDDVQDAGADASDTERATGPNIWYNSWATDDLSFGEVKLTDYPLGMPGFDIFTPYNSPKDQAQIGLGSNSTFLTALKEAGKILSRSYSWWFGLVGAIADAQMDGLLAFGGYDTAKVTGNNYTKALAPSSMSCTSGMNVIVSDLVLNFPNGTDASIISPYSGLSSCIRPDFPGIFTFPWDPYYNSFEALTATTNIGREQGTGGYGGMLYWPGEVYFGDLTIEIDSFFKIRIPNELLVIHPSNIVDNGRTQYNDTVREVLLDPTVGVNKGDTSILGRHFFQAAYLLVNYDSDSFTIWQANATTESSLVSLGNECPDPGSKVAKNDTSGSNTAHSTSSSLPSATDEGTPDTSDDAIPENSSESNGISSEAIAGIAVAAAFVSGGLVVLAVLYILRRRKRQATLASADSSTQLTPANQSNGYDFSGQPPVYEPMSQEMQEMGGDAQAREMSADQKPIELSIQKSNASHRTTAYELGSP